MTWSTPNRCWPSQVKKLSTWPALCTYVVSPWRDERKSQRCQPTIRIKASLGLHKEKSPEARNGCLGPLYKDWIPKLQSTEPSLPKIAFTKYNPLFVHFLASNLKDESSITLTSVFFFKSTCYGLDGRWIEHRWGRDFPHPCRPTLGPNQPPVQSAPSYFRGKTVGAWR
jgi:hypothetical protein